VTTDPAGSKRFQAIVLAASSAQIQSWSTSPPFPSPGWALISGPVTNPSSDIEMFACT
jgi:hypothetical protein